MSFFRWIVDKARPFSINFFRKEITWPSAAEDRCLYCNVRREFHESEDHRFREQEEI